MNLLNFEKCFFLIFSIFATNAIKKRFFFIFKFFSKIIFFVFFSNFFFAFFLSFYSDSEKKWLKKKKIDHFSWFLEQIKIKKLDFLIYWILIFFFFDFFFRILKKKLLKKKKKIRFLEPVRSKNFKEKFLNLMNFIEKI